MSVPTVQPMLDSLVRIVEEAWRSAGYRQAAFPAIATEALLQVAPYKTLDAMAALASLARGEASEVYVGSHGSRQVIPLYWGPRFSVCMHAWPDEVGTPHDHAWCGAYQVLAGTSISGSYAFREEFTFDAKFGLGVLERTRIEFLPPGSTVPVYRGLEMIHGLSYVDRLGVSISIRTNENPQALTCEFLSPGVRIEGSQIDRRVHDQLKTIDAALALDPARASHLLERVLRAADPRSSFFLLRFAAVNFRGRMDVDRLFDIAAPAFGGRAQAVSEALVVWEREQVLRRRRPALERADHRLVMAVLHMARTRLDVERMIANHGVSESPAAFVSRCIVELASSPGVEGMTLLGTPASADFHAVLAHLLEDPRTESVLQRLEDEYDAEDIRDLTPVLSRACESLRTLPLLQPLFAASPHRGAA